MGKVTNLQVALFPLGVLGIVASLLVLVAPRPQLMGSGICYRENFYIIEGSTDKTPMQDGDYQSNRTRLEEWVLKPNQTDRSCLHLQRLVSLDGGFSHSVDEAFGFPDIVTFTSILHILANASLLYGAFQSIYDFVWVYIVHFILTSFGTTYVILTFWNDYPYESHLFAMCLWPVESVPILFANSVTLAMYICIIRFILIGYIDILLLIKMMDDKEKSKPAPQKKIHDDKLFVIPV